MTTIVSGFLGKCNINVNRSFDKYVELGIKLLNINVPKIIFVDQSMYDKIKSFDNEFTKIILYDKKDSYLYSYVSPECLINFQVNTPTPQKDSMEYMSCICNKTEWIKQAIEINHFNTNQFIWVDFAIRHVITNDDIYTNFILNLQNKPYAKIRIASIWNLDANYDTDIYKQIAWYFAGGVVGGDKEQLLIFSEKMKNICLKTIIEKQTITWEVNLWYLIYKEHPDLFDPYYCDHNNSILENY